MRKLNRSEMFWKRLTNEFLCEAGTTHRNYENQILPNDSYWNGTGKYERQHAELGKLIPSMGRVKNPRKNKHLEHFRAVCNAYYDLYNNGGWNRPSQIYTYAGKRTVHNIHVYLALEFYLNYVGLAAHAEQIGLDTEVKNVA